MVRVASLFARAVPQPLLVRHHSMQGFNLNTAVHFGADERQTLEQLCPYSNRAALASERVHA